MRKVKRQVGSEKLWLEEKAGLFWYSVLIHNGRTTSRLNGPTAATLEDAKEGLNEAVRALCNTPSV